MSPAGNSLQGRPGSPPGRDDGGRTRRAWSGERVGCSVAPPAQRAATTSQGFAVLWVAIKREPWIFTLSTIGSLLFGALTVADAWVLGWSTDHVLLPAFEDGEIGAGLLVAVLALFLGVALLRAVGIVARRLGAGIMQYRMQAHSRRAVTRQYLSLPMEWHQRHPTGELLSNANSDVEAAWGPIAPLPMAVGTVAMMVIAVVQMFVADLVLALVGLLVFPAGDRGQPRLPAARVAADDPRPGAARRGQRDRPRVLRRRDGGQDAGPRGRGDRPVRGQGPRAPRRQHPRRPDPRGVRPDPGRAAQPRRARRARRRRQPGAQRRHRSPATWSPSPTCSPSSSFPIRSIGWLLGEFPRSVVGLPAGQPGARRHRRDAVRRPRRRRPARAAPGSRCEHLGYSYVPGQRLLDGRRLHRRARPHGRAWSAPPRPARAR